MPALLKDHTYYVGDSKRPAPLIVNEEWIAIEVARHWDLKPWEYRALLPEYIAELRAAYDVHRCIERYHHTEEEKISDTVRRRAAAEQAASGSRR